jgi:hypothetical protein
LCSAMLFNLRTEHQFWFWLNQANEWLWESRNMRKAFAINTKNVRLVSSDDKH